MNNIKWLIQSTGTVRNFNESNKIIETLNQLNYQWFDFGLIPFTNDITNLENIIEPNDIYIIIGGVKILNLLETLTDLKSVNHLINNNQNTNKIIKSLKNGVFYNKEKFDQAYYNQFNLPLINKDADIYPLSQIKDKHFDYPVFVKPSTDQKAFNAFVLEKGETIEKRILNSFYNPNYVNENIVVAPIKKINEEYRFSVVNNKIVGQSRYFLNGSLNVSSEVPEPVIKKAQEYAKLYQPHDIFTMDLGVTEHEIGIVEYNCWNCSGHYGIDLNTVYSEIHHYMQRKKPKIKNCY